VARTSVPPILAEGLKMEVWGTDSLVKDPIALQVGDDGSIYYTRSPRRNNAEFDIRGHQDWEIRSIALQTIEDKRNFLRTELSPERSAQNEWLADLNGDGSHDWKDMLEERNEVFQLKDTDGDGITDDKDDCPTIVNPKAPVIAQTNEINLTTSGGAVYQWFLNGIALTNSNSGNIQAIETGNYSVQFKTDKGCISPISKSVMVLITEISEANTPKIFPNPVKESLQIEFPKVFGQTVQLSIFDIKGQLIWHKDHLANKSLLDLRFLPSGTFFLQLRSNENERLYTQKLLKE
jgi:hypothetical protein